MKLPNALLLGFWILIQPWGGFAAPTRPALDCGATITADTTLTADIACPADAPTALFIGASGLTLDLGGHTILGFTPNTGILVSGKTDVTIRNGVIDGFNVGVSLTGAYRVTLHDLTVSNMNITDPDQFLFGVAVVNSRSVVVRDSLFEFPPAVPHKEAVEVFGSDITITNIDVHGGGSGVSFSFLNDVCDPQNSPSNGVVLDSTFSDLFAGMWVACTSSVLITGNTFTGCPDCVLGIQADAPFSRAVTGLDIRDNFIHGVQTGIELRGVLDSSVTANAVFDNLGWGIAVRRSLGCYDPKPGWECFPSTHNLLANNQAWGNLTEYHHDELVSGNTWTGNTCWWKDGAEIPDCTPPDPTLSVNASSGKPGSFFSVQGANFPPAVPLDVSANGIHLGQVTPDASGDLSFLLDSTQASPGVYYLTTSDNPDDTIHIVLDTRHRLRPQEGAGPTLLLPAGIATRRLYLPALAK